MQVSRRAMASKIRLHTIRFDLSKTSVKATNIQFKAFFNQTTT